MLTTHLPTEETGQKEGRGGVDMKWCVAFPEDDVILVSRRSLRLACGGNSNAGDLLSHLLYRVSIRKEAEIEAQTINEVKADQGLTPDQDLNSTTIKRTQAQILQGMDSAFSDRTLRDDAIPCLAELQYITVKEIKGNKNYSEYTLNLSKIQEGINHPEKVPSYKTMRYRKKFRTEKVPNDSVPHSEDSPNGNSSEPERKILRTGAEDSPNRSGNSSERELAHKAAPQVPRGDKILPPKSIKEITKEITKEREKERETLSPTVSSPLVSSLSLSSEKFLGETKGAPSASVVVVSPATGGGNAQPLTPDPVGNSAPIGISHSSNPGGNAQPFLPDLVTKGNASKPPDNDAPVLQQNTLLAQLTEEQNNFWTRWCAVAGCSHRTLNETAYKHVVDLAAGKVSTTEDLQSLYDFAYARIREFAASKGVEAVAPRLGNLVNAWPDWQATRAQKQRDLDQEKHDFVPGIGAIRNWTMERLEGRVTAPPLQYLALPSAPVRPKLVAPVGDAALNGDALRAYQERRAIREEAARRARTGGGA